MEHTNILEEVREIVKALKRKGEKWRTPHHKLDMYAVRTDEVFFFVKKGCSSKRVTTYYMKHMLDGVVF